MCVKERGREIVCQRERERDSVCQRESERQRERVGDLLRVEPQKDPITLGGDVLASIYRRWK